MDGVESLSMRAVTRLIVPACLLLAALPTVASAGPPPPDLSIARHSRWGDYVGEGVIDRDGHGERVASDVPPGKEREFWVKVTNTDTSARTFRISGSGSGALFSIAYLDDRMGEVTAAVTGGTYEITVQPGKHSFLELDVTAAPGAQTDQHRTISVRAQDASGSGRTDEVRAKVTVPPIRVWSVTYDGTLRCTATFPDRELDPGSETGVRFTLTNLTDRTISSYSYGELVFRDASGTKLWDTSPKFEGPQPGVGSIGPHDTKTMYAYDTRIRWSGPLSVIPVCVGLRLTMPTVTLPVSSPGAPATVDDAIAAAVAVAGSPFQSCPPGHDGAAETGSFDAPDGRALPPLTLRCWADVRLEDGFDVVSLQLVSPDDAPDYTIPEDTFVFGPAPLPGTDNMLAARWDLVVTAQDVIPYYAILFDRALGDGTSYFYVLQKGTWDVWGYGPCGYEGAALSTNGETFFLDWISACTQQPSSGTPDASRISRAAVFDDAGQPLVGATSGWKVPSR
jgi:hypothetical protein